MERTDGEPPQVEQRETATATAGHLDPGAGLEITCEEGQPPDVEENDPINVLSHNSVLVAASDMYYRKQELTPRYINFQLTVTGDVLCLRRVCEGGKETLTVLYHGDDIDAAVKAGNRELDAMVAARYVPTKASATLRFDAADIRKAVTSCAKRWVNHSAA